MVKLSLFKLHYMLRMAGLPGGYGKAGSAQAYKALFKQNPATRAAAHQILILAARIFDKECAQKTGFKIAPIIKRQIKMGQWDF